MRTAVPSLVGWSQRFRLSQEPFVFKNRNKVGASFQKMTFWTFSQHRAFPLSFSKAFLAAEMLPGRADPLPEERVSGSVV